MRPTSVPAPPKVVERFFEFSLLGMLASGYFAVASSGYLDWPTAMLTLGALCLRTLMAAGILEVEISGGLADALAITFVVFYPLDYFYISGRFLPATLHFIFFLLVCKVLTARSTRDFTYLKVLAALELLGAAILSTSLSFFGFLALFLLFAIASFASGEVRVSTQMQRSVVRGGLARISAAAGHAGGFSVHRNSADDLRAVLRFAAHRARRSSNASSRSATICPVFRTK